MPLSKRMRLAQIVDVVVLGVMVSVDYVLVAVKAHLFVARNF
ncbi:MAG: hypothetical protein SAK29_25515 [Scytonema sp. PMC 1069.18]|nr:hypothetical protein [Scytonema sp. PMC 1069.18]MEC4881531.1 hypothetical protein [Scytonema sp. PMC 1070.18]